MMRGANEIRSYPLRAEHAVARTLADSDDAGPMQSKLLAAIGEALGWPTGAIWEAPVAQDDPMCCVETWHVPGTDLEAFATITRGTRLVRGEGLPGRVWASAAPAWLADVGADSNFPRAAAAVRAGLHAAFCFPVRSGGRVLGAIEFFDRGWREPDEELLATMAILGGQIGQFIERRRAEQAVRDSEQLKRAMLEAALDAVVTIDEQSRIVDFNTAAERIFGCTRKQVLGRDMAEAIIPPWLRERHRRGLARYVQTGEGKVLDRRVEIVGMRAGGLEFPVELTITRIDMPGPPRFTGFLRDITDRRRAEAELKASRARIVEAADVERRRIERNLHDGAQQRLVWVGYGLRTAREALDRDPAAAVEALDDAIAGLAQAGEELRELARGIHPAVLSEGGLEPALTILAERCATPVELDVTSDERFPAVVETAAYFLVAEALTNAARYADASQVRLRAQRVGGALVVVVADDGRGGADVDSGSGLRGLADRVSALGGTFAVESPPGHGTIVRASIPCA
jgi:PAS domain S-box-containing protein